MRVEPYLNQKQAAERLQCSISKLKLLRRSGQLDFVRLGHRTIRYAPAEIDRYQRRASNRKERKRK